MWLSRSRTRVLSMRMQVLPVALFSVLRVCCCCKLQHRLQMLLRSGIAVALLWCRLAAAAPLWPLAPGTSICHKFGNMYIGIPVVVQQKWIWLVSMKMQVWSLALLSGLRIRCCCELWCRSQMQLGSLSTVAVVQAGDCSSDSTPSLGTSICHNHSPKKRGKKKSLLWPRFHSCLGTSEGHGFSKKF